MLIRKVQVTHNIFFVLENILNLQYSDYFLFTGVERGSGQQEDKWLSKSEIKNQLLESIIINEVVESEELSQDTEKVQEPEEAAKVIK